ncbi:hypothetical protein Sjap_019082 [Stephania japonica]|uniref:Mitochondrial proton/calcium exchanger protein n=1 Tax=Stephania japonica TaxID=461633 RepID=A0AAP0F5B5_9MAGN
MKLFVSDYIRLWALVLGIGPSLRAVALMNRLVMKQSRRLHFIFADSLLSGRIGPRNCVIGRMSLSRRCGIIGWLGMELLWADLKIAFQACWWKKFFEEGREAADATADIFRLVPLAVFIIVPFMELLLPEALKRRIKLKKWQRKFKVRQVKNSRKQWKIWMDEFLNKVRMGARVCNDEILSFAKLFNNELTLDNISWIKNDDMMILAEGVESLSEPKLRQACRDRGLLGLRSVEEMRQQLRDWLDLSLKHSVPFSLLILSRKLRPEEIVINTMSSLPDEVVDTVDDFTHISYIHSNSLSAGEREEFLRLVNKEKLEKEIDDLDAKIGDSWRLLDRDYDGKLTSEEAAASAMYLKDTLGREGVQERISNLSKGTGK